MALELGPFKINPEDKLRTGFRAKYNLLLNKIIKDAVPYTDGFKLVTHDNTEIEVDLTEFFYNKETIDELFILAYATEEEAGKIRIATMDEVFEGEDDLTVVTPYKLSMFLAYFNGRVFEAGEDLEYGDMVCLVPTFEYEDPEDLESPRTLVSLTAMKALATAKSTLCDGFVEEGGLLGEEVFIKLSGSINQAQIGLYPHKWYYLSDVEPGKITDKKPTGPGTFAQPVGYAISEEELMVELEDAVQIWEPIFEELPPIIFTVEVESTQSLNLAEYITEWNADKKFTYEFIDLPEWISEHTIVFDFMELTGLAPEVGEFTAYLEVTDEEGNIGRHPLQIIVIPATEIEVGLIDMETGEVVGLLPGSYPLPPLWKIRVKIIGPHNRIEIETAGGGPDGTSLDNQPHQYSEAVEYTEEAIYEFHQDTEGFVSEAGQYLFTCITFRDDLVQSADIFNFILYDEEWLSKVKYELWDAENGVKLGDINPDGSSTFKYVRVWDVKVIAADLPHNLVGIVLTNQTNEAGSVVVQYPQDPPVSDAEYFIYDVSGIDRAPGQIRVAPVFQLDGDVAFQGYVDFEVLDKGATPEGGLKLINMIPNTADHEVILSLPLAGGTFDKPDNWSVLSEYEGEEIDYVSWVHYIKGAGGWANVNSTPYTKQPQSISYKVPVTEAEVRAFWDLGSTEVGEVDEVPSEHRFIFTYRSGGASGKIIMVQQSDFALRVPLLPGEHSGLRFSYVKAGVPELIDPNMPNFDGKYVLREDAAWTVSVLDFGGVPFNKVKVQMHKKIAGVYYLLHLHSADAVQTWTGATTTKLTSDLLACIIGEGSPRILYNTAGDEILIDEIGEYNVIMTGYNGITVVGALTSEFEIIEEPEETPIKDCCGGGGLDPVGGTIVPRDGMDQEIIEDVQYLDVRVDGTTIEIEEPTNPTKNQLRVKKNGLGLDHLPKIPDGYVLGNDSGGTADVYLLSIDDLTSGSGVSGTPSRVPKFSPTGNSLVDSLIFDNGTTVLIGSGANIGKLSVYGGDIHTDSKVSGTGVRFPATYADKISLYGDSFGAAGGTNIGAESGGMYHKAPNYFRWYLGANADGGVSNIMALSNVAFYVARTIRSLVSDGTAPIQTDSLTLCPNLNADLLDGQHGAWYRDRANHTGTQLAATISDFGAAVRATPLTGLSVTTGTITAADTVLSAFGKLQGQINTISGTISGTTNFLAMFTGSGIGDSILSQNGISLVANGGQFTSDVAPNVNPRGLSLTNGSGVSRWAVGKAGLESGGGSNSGSDLVFGRFNDAGGFLGYVVTVSRATGFMSLAGTLTVGGSGVVISTTSTTLNPNFNSDLLDGEHGVFYLDRANHTGTQLAATISDFGNAVRSTPLTGYTVGTDVAITATDTVLQAFGKLQAQVNGVNGTIGAGTVDYFPVYTGTNAIGPSTTYRSGTAVVNGGHFISDTAHNVNVIGFYMRASGVARWGMGKAGTETGVSNTGSDWVLWAFNDAGTYTGEAIRVNRNTRFMTLAGTLTVGGSGVVISTTSTALNPNFNSDLLDGQHGAFYQDRANHTGSQAISTVTGLQAALDAKTTGAGTANTLAMFSGANTIADSIVTQTGTTKITVAGRVASNIAPSDVSPLGFYLEAGGLARWIIGKFGLETGSNAGSDFYLSRISDTGVFLGNAMRVTRATGAVIFETSVSGVTPTAAAHFATKAYVDGLIAVGGVTGTGTAGRLPKFTASSTIGDSMLSESGIAVTANGGVFVSDIPFNSNVRGYGLSALGVSRWTFGKAGNEAGSNSGSDFTLWAYSDAGAFLRESMRISRATGDMTLTGGIQVTGGNSGQWNTAYSWGNHSGLYISGGGTANKIPMYTANKVIADSIMTQSGISIMVDGQMVSNIAPSGTGSRGFGFYSGGLARWTVGKFGLETGSNAGSDLVFYRFNDAGSFLGEVININRATGITTFSLPAGGVAPTANNHFTPKSYVDAQLATALNRANHTGSQAISTVTGLQSALDGKVNNWGNGVDNRFALWVDSGRAVGNSNLYNNAGNIGVGMNPGYPLDVNGGMRINSQITSTVGTGTSPFSISSTSLVGNLNADYLDGQHGSYYLDWNNFSNKPSLYTTSQVDSLLAGKANSSHTHNSSQITDWTSAVRNQLSGTGGISYNPATGQISYSGGSGISGSGSNGYIMKWTGGTSAGNSTILDTGSEVNFNNSRSFGVEGPAAFRNYLHVHGYQSNGTASNHGAIAVHNSVSYTPNSSCAIDINSTTRGMGFPVMTESQMTAISSPKMGLVVCTYPAGSMSAGLKIYLGVWFHIPISL